MAIFPFVARGDDGDLGVAVSDLLNAALDGMASVHVVDRRQLLRDADSAQHVLNDPVTAQALARGHGRAESCWAR